MTDMPYNGQVLVVDLSRERITEKRVEEDIYRDFFGGYGLGVRYTYENLKPRVHPLSPENILGITPGLLSGTGAWLSGRFMVSGKSPLTGTWGDSNCGGHFSSELKRAGFDGIFIKGKSHIPVFLQITEEGPELREAGHLWGKDTYETEDLIRKELGNKGKEVICIGPSGERGNLISSIMTKKGRAAGRSGLGALMGSKNLKAIAVKGFKKIKVFDEEKFRNLNKNLIKRLNGISERNLLPLKAKNIIVPLSRRLGISFKGKPSFMFSGYKKYGTCLSTSISSESGSSPVKNWKGVGYIDFPMKKRASKIGCDEVIKYEKKKFACSNCTIACGGILKSTDGKYPIKESHKPEYETLASFGTLCLNDDLESIMKINDICNRYGIDTISTGSVIAFSMECYEAGIISKEDADGLELKWGNHEAIVKLTQKIAKREGFGEILADGVKVASAKIGKESEKFAIHVHGQELPMLDPRYHPPLATAYLSDPTPGRHTTGAEGQPNIEEYISWRKFPRHKRYEYSGRGDAQAATSNFVKALSALGLCIFSIYTVSKLPILEITNAATGWNMSMEDFLMTGERIQTVRHAFNIREGIKQDEMEFPERVRGSPPLVKGPNANVTLDTKRMVMEYYESMNWDYETGLPSKERLKELNLDFVIKDLWKDESD